MLDQLIVVPSPESRQVFLNEYSYDYPKAKPNPSIVRHLAALDSQPLPLTFLHAPFVRLAVLLNEQ